MLMMMPPFLRYFWFHSIYSLAASWSVQSAVCSLQMSYTAGQISAHYSSSKIRKTNLRLFRPEQGPRAVLEVA